MAHDEQQQGAHRRVEHQLRLAYACRGDAATVRVELPCLQPAASTARRGSVGQGLWRGGRSDGRLYRSDEDVHPRRSL